jgi:hypothetical protein
MLNKMAAKIIPYKDNSLKNPEFKEYCEKSKLRLDDITVINYDNEHIMYLYLTNYKDPSGADRVICKIGYSQGITTRKKELESKYKCKFYLIGVKKIKGQKEEKEFHKLLKSFFLDLYPCIKEKDSELTEFYIFDKRIIKEFDAMKEYNVSPNQVIAKDNNQLINNNKLPEKNVKKRRSFDESYVEFSEWITISKDKRLPNCKAPCPIERRLGIWVKDIRRDYKAKILTKEKVDKLEGIALWKWSCAL